MGKAREKNQLPLRASLKLYNTELPASGWRVSSSQQSEGWDAVTIAPAILEKYPDLNDAQREIAHGEGPLLVVAGPGSGKTYSIVLRALNSK
jgi:hypothetical protein